MIITSTKRTYSRSINTKNFGLNESWIKIESTYEAQCESGDDAVKVSGLLYDQAKADVLANINQIIEQIEKSKAPAPTTVAPVAPSNPVATPYVAPAAPVYTAPAAPAYVPPTVETPAAPVVDNFAQPRRL